jgi:two-component system sensor histidine kinase TctE
MRRFTADASHQMRTPLAVLRMHLDLIRRRGAVGGEDRAALDDVDGAARRLERLLAQLIALARADEGGQPGAGGGGVADLAAVVAEVVAERAPAALAAGVEVQLERPPAPVPVRADAFLIGEMAANLLDNAVRYNRPGGTALVRVASGDGEAMIEIEDEGPGIPDAERSRVFDRFHRIERKGGPEGTGLGLAIVRALADRLGARVELCDPAKGFGLLVRVHFRREREARRLAGGAPHTATSRAPRGFRRWGPGERGEASALDG